MRLVSPSLAGICLASVLLTAGAARGQAVDESARAATRQMALDGIAAYKKSQFQEAHDKIGRAYSVIRVPTLGLWTARSLERLGKLVESSERYLEIARLSTEGSSDAELQEAAKRAAVKELAELLPRIPKLRVVIKGVPADGVAVTIDGRPLHAGLVGTLIPTNPGEHRVTARLGKSRADATVKLEEKQTKDVEVMLDPGAAGDAASGDLAKPDDPATEKDKGVTPEKSSGSFQRTLGYISIGVGGATLVGGSVFGVMAIGTKGKLDDGDCMNGQCGPTEHPNVERYNRQRNIATVGIIAGSVIAAAGVTLLITAPKKSKTAQKVGVWLGPASAGVSARF